MLSREGTPLENALGGLGQGLVPRTANDRGPLAPRTSCPGNPACSWMMTPPGNPSDFTASDPRTSASPNPHCTGAEAEGQRGAGAKLELYGRARQSQSWNPLGLRVSTYDVG